MELAETIKFINELYSQEPDPIFEQNWLHILSYTSFQNTLSYETLESGSFIQIFTPEHKSITFTPFIQNPSFWDELVLFHNNLLLSQIFIQNVSEHWLATQSDYLNTHFAGAVEYIPRSKEEVVYDIDRLTALEGGHYSNLRHIRNKLVINGGLSFEKISQVNLDNALHILHIWQRVQGEKYIKNKLEKELSVLEKMVDFQHIYPQLQCVLAYFEQRPVGVIVFFTVPTFPTWGEIYMVKGINKTTNGGVRGVSDGLYLYAFQQLKNMGCLYCNDGEMGYEEGTRAHKLSFQPSRYLKSFDIVITL